MIEALIDLRLDGERTQQEHGAVKTRGDVLAVKLTGSPWSSEEQKYYLVVEWQDGPLQAQLLARRNAGEQNPVISFPYREADENGQTTIRSRRFFDINELGTSTREAVLNRHSRVERLERNSRAEKTR